MARFHQVLLIGAFVPLCWLGMMAAHELGHVLAALASGGSVAKVVLHPLTISRTDLAVNPHPLVVVWAGPVFGVATPLALWAAARLAGWRWWYLARWFAGFCLIANGAYIAGGSFDRVGDCGDMLRHGSPIWTLWLFGLATVPAGLLLWHRLGPFFGLGEASGEVDRAAAYFSSALLAAALLLSFAPSPT